ncbi:MAG TPA: CHAT domain-containing protein [Candidatus Krumholzibacteria bacterium]|nr:CHAT domain-containing protein [Candidatus Krumholzibacteria bacterium]
MFRAVRGKQWLMIAGACALLFLAAGCGADRREPLLPDQSAAALALLDAPRDTVAFDRWVATGSAERLLDLRSDLLDAVYAPASVDTALQRRRVAALALVDGALARVCGLPVYRRETAALAALPPDSAAAARQRIRRLQEIFADPDLDMPTKLARIGALQAMLEAADHWDAAADGLYAMAPLQQDRGDGVSWASLHRRGLALARAHDLLPATCRAWGQLMMANMQRGWTPAERDTLRQLQDRARAARLARTSSYLLTLQGYDAFNQGRYATARALFEDGIAVCRDLGDPAQALATMDMLLRMYGLFECWDQVDQLLVRARAMQQERAARPSAYVGGILSDVRHRSLAARSLAAHGRLDEAHVAFADAFALASRLPYAETEYLGQQWFTALMDADRPDLAAEAIATVGREAEPHPGGPIGLRLPLWRAWLAWRGGDPVLAAAQLDSFAARADASNPVLLGNLPLRQAALQARVLAVDDAAAADRALAQGWNDLLMRLRRHEASPEAYLDLARNGQLRSAAHDILGRDADVGYGLELLWRRTFLVRWPAPPAPAADGRLAEAARSLAAAACGELGDRDAIHCLYRVERDRVVCWTADGGSVSRRVLDVTPQELQAEVADVLDQLSRDPGDADAPLPGDLADALAALARRLLPARVLEPDRRPRALYVSGDATLAQVPFSPLNLDQGGGYLPLVAAMDVAWLRGGPMPAAGDRAGRATGSLVVADPTLDASTRRRFSLPAGLPGATAEMAALSGRLPEARVLSGDRATRPQVVASWEDADVFYFVGHAVREAEVPFSAWLPLAAADSADVYPGLDLADVLSAHLDRCRLVVLSGCATGAPYVDGLSATPSLGDAFLDAGAGAVIQTFWRVRDEGAVLEPERILAAWQEGGLDLPAAVSAERRRALQGPRGVRHPFGWAAWTLKSAWLPPACGATP